MTRTWIVVATLACLYGVPGVASVDAEAQSIVRRAKGAVKAKAAERKRQTEDSLIAKAVEPVDSAMAKSARPVEGAMDRATAHADSAVSRIEQTIAAAARGDSREVQELAADLGQGRAVLDEVRFIGASDQLAPESEPQLIALAAALRRVPGTFLLEVYVAAGVDGAGVQAATLSEQRAIAVKQWLIAAAVPEHRLFALGRGAHAADEIAMVRMP